MREELAHELGRDPMDKEVSTAVRAEELSFSHKTRSERQAGNRKAPRRARTVKGAVLI